MSAQRDCSAVSIQIRIVRAVTIVCYIVALLLTPRLWLSGRFYALTPVSSLLPALIQPIDHICYLLLMVIPLGGLIERYSRTCLRASVLSFLLYSLWDQQRWVPFFYHFAALMLVLSFANLRGGDEQRNNQRNGDVLRSCALILAGTYFWSGLQKFNILFFTNVVPWMLRSYLPYDALPAEMATGIAFIVGLCGAVGESLLGLGLTQVKWQRKAVIIGLLMHCFILGSVGPGGHNFNTQVWGWNIGCMVLLVVLFRDGLVISREWFSLKGPRFSAIVVLFFWFLPSLNLIGLWDDYLSMTLYSGNTESAFVAFNAEAGKRFPTGLQPVFRPYTQRMARYFGDKREIGSGPTSYFSFRDWAYFELNVPDYHAQRLFRNVFQGLCVRLGSPEGLELIVQGKSHRVTGMRDRRHCTCRDPGTCER